MVFLLVELCWASDAMCNVARAKQRAERKKSPPLSVVVVVVLLLRQHAFTPSQSRSVLPDGQVLRTEIPQAEQDKRPPGPSFFCFSALFYHTMSIDAVPSVMSHKSIHTHTHTHTYT